MTAERRRLPNRRACETINVSYEGHEFALTASRRAGDGKMLELFLSSPKTGAGIAAVDAAIIISVALQCGIAVADLLHSIKRDSDGNPSSLIGAALDALARLELE